MMNKRNKKGIGIGTSCQHEYYYPRNQKPLEPNLKFMLDTSSEERITRTKRHRTIRIKTEYGCFSVSEAAKQFGFKPSRFYNLKKKCPAWSKTQLLTFVIGETL